MTRVSSDHKYQKFCQIGRIIIVIASGNKLQLMSPSKYSSLFSASMLAITFSNSLNRLGGELGGRYPVPTKNGVLRGLLISTNRHYK